MEDHYDPLPDWGRDTDFLLHKMKYLENLARRDNLQIYGVPDALEKDDMLGYHQLMLQALPQLQLQRPLDFQRAHHVRSHHA
ncbi:hypothetical protein NDU88_002190 [Pleurodeles waltl]|uniref:Uncharacterized protein n=1 Tax=Pleurodeles waltl TaxID=8319 RepID=A0AAV7W2N0_PLEWA|nr:hypothetical protein NDU88_002190 [Pleurodeles waltl]